MVRVTGSHVEAHPCVRPFIYVRVIHELPLQGEASPTPTKKLKKKAGPLVTLPEVISYIPRAYFIIFFLKTPSPNNPLPSRSIVDGSGTGFGAVTTLIQSPGSVTLIPTFNTLSLIIL